MLWSKYSRDEEWEGQVEILDSAVRGNLREGAAFVQSPEGGAREAMGICRKSTAAWSVRWAWARQPGSPGCYKNANMAGVERGRVIRGEVREDMGTRMAQP